MTDDIAAAGNSNARQIARDRRPDLITHNEVLAILDALHFLLVANGAGRETPAYQRVVNALNARGLTDPLQGRG